MLSGLSTSVVMALAAFTIFFYLTRDGNYIVRSVMSFFHLRCNLRKGKEDFSDGSILLLE